MPPGKTDQTMELCRHVGRHQEHLALDAIPRYLDELVIDEENKNPENHDLQPDELPTLEENVETGSPTRSLEPEPAPQDQRYSISIQADQSFSQEVWVRQKGGKSKIMIALLKSALPFNIVTSESAKKFNMGPAKDARVARIANLTSFGDVTFTRFVTASISTSGNGSQEGNPYSVAFYLLPDEVEQLSHQRTKPLAEAVLGHQFMSAMTDDEQDGIVEDPAKAFWVDFSVPAYHLRLKTLEQFLEELFGAQEFKIVVSSYPNRFNLGALIIPSPLKLRLSDIHGVEKGRCLQRGPTTGFDHGVSTFQKLSLSGRHAFQVQMH
jgi:hypothetical protein